MDGEFEEAFGPVATEIGFLAREWNGLHDLFAKIFAAIVGPSNTNIPLAVWNSVTSDSSQRRMLDAAASSWVKFHPNESVVFNEIKWLLDRSGALSEKRNNAIHAPMRVLKNMRVAKSFL